MPDHPAACFAQVARGIAYRAVRNRGTIGGSLAHADPAADWLSALRAARCRVRRRGRARQPRRSRWRDLRGASFTTELQPDELIRSVRVPKLSAGARWGFHKFCRKTGEFADAIGGVLHDPARGRCRAVIGAIETAPIVVADADARCSAAASVPIWPSAWIATSVLQRLDGRT